MIAHVLLKFCGQRFHSTIRCGDRDMIAHQRKIALQLRIAQRSVAGIERPIQRAVDQMIARPRMIERGALQQQRFPAADIGPGMAANKIEIAEHENGLAVTCLSRAFEIRQGFLALALIEEYAAQQIVGARMIGHGRQHFAASRYCGRQIDFRPFETGHHFVRVIGMARHVIARGSSKGRCREGGEAKGADKAAYFGPMFDEMRHVRIIPLCLAFRWRVYLSGQIVYFPAQKAKRENPKGARLLHQVTAVTIIVQDLALSEKAYGEWLDYRIVEKSAVSDALAATWDTPAMVDLPMALLAPASGSDFRLRLIEAPATAGFAPLQCHGWNAVELLVRDPDALAARLAGSPFTILGAPYDLSPDGSARAMQVLGPSGEVLYLTRLQGDHAEFFGTAQSEVDRAFIIVAGGLDHTAMQRFYGETLGQPIVPSDGFAITVLSRANGLPVDTIYPLASARLDQKFSFELDGYPEPTRPRPRNKGALPPGIAMVSVSVADLSAVPLRWRAPPAVPDTKFYAGHRAAVTQGGAGEWLEFIEMKKD